MVPEAAQEPVTTEVLVAATSVQPESSATNGEHNTAAAALLGPSLPAPIENAHAQHTEADVSPVVEESTEDHAHGHAKKDSGSGLKGKLLHVVGK